MRFAIAILVFLCFAHKAAFAEQWKLLPEHSSIGFTASYDDIAFDGHFEKFSVELYFDPKQPAASKLSSSVETASVNTNSRDRDEALADPAWFHFSVYPTANFIGHQISQLDSETFQAIGTLTIRNQKQEITFPFKWRSLNANQTQVSAEFLLDRRDFEIGNGEWTEDETIGFSVNVKISLVLTNKL